MSEVLLAVPVFNEANHVGSVLERSRAYIDDILVVDDGSTDGTAEALDDEVGLHRVTHIENRGYGQSLISAFNYASARGYGWVITMDCDEQHEPSYIPDFINAIRADDADIISGTRYREAMPENTDAPSDRRRINATITILLNRLFDLGLTDAFCGFKAHRVSAMMEMALSIPGYAFPLQFWVRSARLGLRVCELSVPLIYNDPNRHFGGLLDDPNVRLAHYMDVLCNELRDGEAADVASAFREAGLVGPCSSC